MADNRFHTRQAAVALLKMAQATSDPAIAARLIEAAADLKDQAGDLPPPVSAKAPDVKTGGKPASVEGLFHAQGSQGCS
jgi:hypothetical protein